jgi:hypothetical protein
MTKLMPIKLTYLAMHSSGGQFPDSDFGGPGYIPANAMWDVWWEMWYWLSQFP